MSEGDMKNGNSEQIFQAFADLLITQAADQNKRDEARASHTNKAIIKLTESVDTLTKHHIEAKKDQEFNAKRMDRYEIGQEENNKVLKTMSKTILLLEERQKTQRGWMQRLIEAGVVVSTAVIASKLI